jgi:uncharacterized damage-inducible protein DinB
MCIDTLDDETVIEDEIPPDHADIEFPAGNADERELLLGWLGYLRLAVVRKVEGVTDKQSRWTPDGKLISLIGVVSHLTNVEWRWIDGGMQGAPVSRHESEFRPGRSLPLDRALSAYRARWEATDRYVRSAPSLDETCQRQPGTNLRWVLIHLINETARHAGHADATRELLDGTVGE